MFVQPVPPPPQVAHAFRARLISHWEGWLIRTRCADPICPPNRLVCVEELVEARGDMSVAQMANHMRCGVCMQPVARVALMKSCAAGEVINPVRGPAFF